MDVSVIIVNYNTRDLLRGCIDGVIAMTSGVHYEIIVVDNDSHDGSVEMLRSEFPNVTVIESGSNLGFGRANNLGMRHAAGKYLFLLNSDTILLNNVLKIYYEAAESLKNNGEQVGALGAILLGKDKNPCHSFGKFITPGFELRETLAKYLRFLKDSENTHPQSVKGIREVDYITGADMFVPREVFEAIGGFDPDFFMYCEEVDWQKRMQEKGYSRLIIEGPEIIHFEGGCDQNEKKLWSINRLKNLYKSRKLYRKKHYNKVILPFFRIFRLLLDLPSILILALITKRKEYLHLIKLA